MCEIKAANEAARKQWKTAFFAAYHAIGTQRQEEQVAALGRASTVYLTLVRQAASLGVTFDPREAPKEK